MKGESLKCCSIYSVSFATRGGSAASVWWHGVQKDTRGFGRLCTSLAHAPTTRITRIRMHAPTAKLCSWPKTASFSSSLLFWAVGSTQLQEARLWCCTPPPPPSSHTEQICWLTKCDYPLPFITLLVRELQNIWRNRLILNCIWTRGLCFITTAVEFSATQIAFYSSLATYKRGGRVQDFHYCLENKAPPWAPQRDTWHTFSSYVGTSITTDLSVVTAREGRTVIPRFTLWADWCRPRWFSAF